MALLEDVCYRELTVNTYCWIFQNKVLTWIKKEYGEYLLSAEEDREHNHLVFRFHPDAVIDIDLINKMEQRFIEEIQQLENDRPTDKIKIKD